MENLPFKTHSFEKAWNDWLEYRKQRKLPKYVPKGLEKTFTALTRISNDDEKTAILIIEQSMEMGWQGLFPLKNTQNGTKQGSGYSKGAGISLAITGAISDENDFGNT